MENWKRKIHSSTWLPALICLLFGFAGGILVGMKRGIPFVTQKEQWTIGIYSKRSLTRK